MADPQASNPAAKATPVLASRDELWEARYHARSFAVMAAVFLAAPWIVYPQFAMQVLCFALFATAFNLLIGFGGLLSFGHAMFFGMASYFCAYLARSGVKLDTLTLFHHALPLGLTVPPLPPALAVVVAVA